MKRWQVSETERKVLDHVLSEHLRARRARTESLSLIHKARNDTTGRFIVARAQENLAASREVVVLTRDLTHLLRRF